MKKILVIEDDRNIAKALNARLRALGYSVAFAYDAAVAQSQVLDIQPDMVIIDINLPAGNGFQVAERIRQSPDTNHIPFMFITASRREGLRRKATDVGATGFLEKPFLASELVNNIESALAA